MSDGKEVKRTIKGLLLEMKLSPTSDERILAEETILQMFEDQNRIVVELRAEVELLRYELNQLDGERKSAWEIVDVHEATIARQANVIEGVKSALNNHATRPSDALIQIREVIEKEGAKDE